MKFLDQLLLLFLSVLGIKANGYASYDTRIYSYICLESAQEYCLAVSPGDDIPTKEENLRLQVKLREKIEDQGEDWKKTRWDIKNINEVNKTEFGLATIGLSRFDSLYISKQKGKLGSYLLGREWVFNLTSFNNFNLEGRIQYGSNMCLSVMKCGYPAKSYCNPDSNSVVGDGSSVKSGAYVKYRECSSSLDAGQVFRLKLDCATGCSPFLQFNNECDAACANIECDFDNRLCNTTTPTTTPTSLYENYEYSFNQSSYYTEHPTTQAPTTHTPTSSPTEVPTQGPTYMPTQGPTQGPTFSPTHVPTFSPTQGPTFSPTQKPTKKPTLRPKAPDPASIDKDEYPHWVEVMVIFMFVVLFILCAILIFLGFRRYRSQNQ